MAGLTLRNNTWYITYQNESGVPRRISTGCDVNDRDGAEKKKQAFEDSQRLGKIDPYLKHRKRPLTAHIDDYHAYQIAKQFTQKRADGVNMRIKRLFESAGISSADEISESAIQVTLSKLKKKP
jgi:hypothetical protein